MLRQDFSSDVWRRLTALLEKQLKELRERNDADLDPQSTALIRGQIKATKALLDLPKSPDDDSSSLDPSPSLWDEPGSHGA